MKRLWLTTFSLGMVCFWLIGSYLSPDKPIASLYLPLSDSFTSAIVVLCFALFLAIQIWLFFSTRDALGSQSQVQQPQEQQSQMQVSNLQPKIGMELFWTFLPIIFTLLVAWESLMFWQAR